MKKFYRSIHPEFWTGATGQLFRGDYEAYTLALYAITNPHTNISGAYRLPIAYIESDIGMDEKTVLSVFERLSNADFCIYDAKVSHIFVRKMFLYQTNNVGNKPALADGRRQDTRVTAAIRIYNEMADGIVKREFYKMYGESLGLEEN
jgi:hypothetical protein